jgi:hypothetical protein
MATMKNIFIFFFLLFSIFSQSQTYIKGNGATALALIPHIGIETSIGKKSTFQADIMSSFWTTNDGLPLEFTVFTLEYRYHFKEKFNGLYIGGNAGYDIYNVTKWNYIVHRVHQIGIGYSIGATIGYQKKLNDRFTLDFFIGGGNHQGFYHSYYIDTGKRWELDTAVGYNKSGEWLPYRGGIMICYRLK